MRTGCHALGVLLLACGALAAQAQFDVVSIKPAPPTGLPAVIASLLMIRSGRVEAAGITAVDLIAQAYRQDGATLRLSRIVDAPTWATNERYAFTATFEGSTDVATLRERLPYMYRAVLQDRFKLQGHFERRPVPIYALVVSRADGRAGPQLRRSGATSTGNGETYSGPDYYDGYGITLETFAHALDSLKQADRDIVDRTGLDGRFDVELYWSAAKTLAMLGRSSGGAPVEGASLFEAVVEQLGLKLEPRNEPTEVLIVDHIERPSPN